MFSCRVPTALCWTFSVSRHCCWAESSCHCLVVILCRVSLLRLLRQWPAPLRRGGDRRQLQSGKRVRRGGEVRVKGGAMTEGKLEEVRNHGNAPPESLVWGSRVRGRTQNVFVLSRPPPAWQQTRPVPRLSMRCVTPCILVMPCRDSCRLCHDTAQPIAQALLQRKGSTLGSWRYGI